MQRHVREYIPPPRDHDFDYLHGHALTLTLPPIIDAAFQHVRKCMDDTPPDAATSANAAIYISTIAFSIADETDRLTGQQLYDAVPDPLAVATRETQHAIVQRLRQCEQLCHDVAASLDASDSKPTLIYWYADRLKPVFALPAARLVQETRNALPRHSLDLQDAYDYALGALWNFAAELPHCPDFQQALNHPDGNRRLRKSLLRTSRSASAELRKICPNTGRNPKSAR